MLQFNPRAVGRIQLRLITCALASLVSLTFAGSPSIRLSDTSLSFNAVQIGSHSDLVLTIFNDGFTQLNVTGLNGLPLKGFSLVDPPTLPANISAGSSLGVTVRFAPTGEGFTETDLTVTSNDSANPSLPVSLSGIGTPASPELSLSTGGLQFGAVQLGTFQDLAVNFFNDGGSTLTLSSITGLPDDEFTLMFPPVAPVDIAPGGFQGLTVRFAPTTVGAHAALLHVLNNDADEGDVLIGIDGTGATDPACFISQIPVSMYGLDVGGTLTSVKVKHLKTGETKISGKVTISQLRMPDDVTSPSQGVPSLTASLYLLDDSQPCALDGLTTPVVSVVTKAGKAGKPGKPAKSVKAKFSVLTNDQTTSRSALVVLDPDNSILETDKENNFLVWPALP